MFRGRTYHRAGPPIWYHVCGASDTFSATISSRPVKGLALAIRISDIFLTPVSQVRLADFWIFSRGASWDQIRNPRIPNLFSGGQIPADFPDVSGTHCQNDI